MPEGDTIHRTANRLRAALAGQPITAFDAPRLTGDRPRIGDVIDDVEAVGKHLLVRFPRSLVLHTHMKMTGSWHLYRPNERWQEPPHLARATISVPEWTAICFAAPVVATWRDIAGQPSPVAHLGPDLCLADADLDLVVRRVAELSEPGSSICDVLLDQRVAAGIGNVFKSEVLWACRVSPFATVETIDTPTRERLYRTAAKQLRANLTTTTRMTVPSGLAVYDRARRPCLRCSTPVQRENHGEHPRVTYWCPNCQLT